MHPGPLAEQAVTELHAASDDTILRRPAAAKQRAAAKPAAKPAAKAAVVPALAAKPRATPGRRVRRKSQPAHDTDRN